MPKIFTLRNVIIIGLIAVIWRLAASGVFKKIDTGEPKNVGQ